MASIDGQCAPPAIRLKHDHFGSISQVGCGADARIRRDTTEAAFGLRWFAAWVAGIEARALERLAGLDGVPRLISFDGRRLDRGFIDGRPMQEARPRDPAYFRDARRLVLAIHARGVTHNDLAKEPNWLVRDDGRAAVVDFQMAYTGSRHSRFFRLLAWEDLRHLLKHKRHYLPETLTPVERRVLARRSWIARAWRASGKRIYNFVTRRILDYRDNEGRG
jgi:RIO-like serine/threonine protein kinase